MQGKRVCVGKTFAEVEAKTVVPIFLEKLHFELTDELKMKEKKPATMLVLSKDIRLKISLRK